MCLSTSSWLLDNDPDMSFYGEHVNKLLAQDFDLRRGQCRIGRSGGVLDKEELVPKSAAKEKNE